jgi:putative restriction endonuclease
MKTAAQVLEVFDNIRRAQRSGVYAPHKPLLILLALARLQRKEPRLVEFSAIDASLQSLLTEFGPSGSAKSRHYPFWHLATDGRGSLWDLNGPRELLSRPAGATPNLGELRSQHVQGGFPPELDEALRKIPGLLEAVATRVLETFFPSTLQGDIAAAVGLDLERTAAHAAGEPVPGPYMQPDRRQRDPGFRMRVLRAYEYRCCVCGFDLRIGQVSAGLEAATSSGITWAARMSNPTGWPCARCITSCSTWAPSRSNRPSTAWSSASTPSPAIAARRVNSGTTGNACWHRSRATCDPRHRSWPGT